VYPNFGERREREVRRIPLPRTRVNKGEKKGRGCYAPALNSSVLRCNPLTKRVFNDDVSLTNLIK
jgi:hypothetical protein